LIDYMQHLAIRLVRSLVIDPERMRANLEMTYGALFSQRVLLALVAAGHSRDNAYRIVQEQAQRAWAEHTQLRDLLAADPRAAELDLEAIFDYGAFTRYVPDLIARLDPIAG
jgi:adenylosuccinate lyase